MLLLGKQVNWRLELLVWMYVCIWPNFIKLKIETCFLSDTLDSDCYNIISEDVAGTLKREREREREREMPEI